MSEAVTPGDLRERRGLKWTRYEEEVLPAWVAEMDFGLAPAITEALHDAVEWGDTAYFYPDIERAAAQAATSFWSERFDWDVDAEGVFPALLGELVGAHLPNVGYAEPDATYLAWLDFGGYGLDDPADYLLEEAKVAVTGGGLFGVGGKGHARLNFATPGPILTQIVERIGDAL